MKSRYATLYRKAKLLGPFIDKYAEKFKLHLIKSFLNEPNIENLNIDYLKKILGMVINEDIYQNHLKLMKMKVGNEITQFLILFDECSKTYSHKKFESLIKSQPFRYLFVYFAETVEDSFLNKILAIKSNLDVYKQAISQIKEIVIAN